MAQNLMRNWMTSLLGLVVVVYSIYSSHILGVAPDPATLTLGIGLLAARDAG